MASRDEAELELDRVKGAVEAAAGELGRLRELFGFTEPNAFEADLTEALTKIETVRAGLDDLASQVHDYEQNDDTERMEQQLGDVQDALNDFVFLGQQPEDLFKAFKAVDPFNAGFAKAQLLLTTP